MIFRIFAALLCQLLFQSLVIGATLTGPATVPSSVEAADLRIKTTGTLSGDGSWELNQNGYIGDDYTLTANTVYNFVVNGYGNSTSGSYPVLKVYIDSYLIKTITVSDYSPTDYKFSYKLKEGGTRRLRFVLGNPASSQETRLHVNSVAIAAAGTVNPGGSSALVNYDFTAGDTLAAKSGWSFASPTWPITAVGTSYFKGLGFTYPATLPGKYSSREMRFRTPPGDQFWVQLRLHVPVNYAHRFDTRLSMPAADIASWQVGDRVRGVDGQSEGVISAVYLAAAGDVGSPGIFLRNPTNAWSNAAWVGPVHNLTRTLSASSTARAMWSSNNKFLAMWADGYSAHGAGPSIVWELWPVQVAAAGQTARATTLAVHYSKGNHTGAGPHLNASGGPFIDASDAGKYIDVVVHGKFSSSTGAKDGVIQTWIRKETALQFTRVHNITNADMDKRLELAPELQPWQAGYLMGWSNSGFDQATTFHISKIQYFKEQPAELGQTGN